MVKQAVHLSRNIAIYSSALLMFCMDTNVYSAEWLLESDISAEAGYNDNLFLETNPADGVWVLKVAPTLRVLGRERHWDTFIDARLRSNTYSDQAVDSVDKYLKASGSYRSQRNIYSLGGAYSLVSNLARESPDFGLATQNVLTERISVSPEYTRLMTERAALSLSYNHTDVDYRNAGNTGFVPYTTDTITGSINYSLTFRTSVSLILQGSDYSNRDRTIEYQLYVGRLGVEHRVAELWNADVSVGGSRRNATTRTTALSDFIEQPIGLSEELNFSDTGYVLNAGVSRRLEAGSVGARVGRNNVPSSQGGLNVVNRISFSFNQGITELWRYALSARYEDINAFGDVQRSSDREVFFFNASLSYRVTRNLNGSVGYRYVSRRFKSDTSDDRAPHSNALFLRISYNFPSLSSF